MVQTVTVPKWENHDTNIQGNIEQSDFTRSDRVVIYTAPTPLPDQESTTMKAVFMGRSPFGMDELTEILR